MYKIEDETRRVETRKSAIALIEDLDHIRRLLAADGPDPAELRRLSVVLRKQLIDNALSKVAAPRIGRIRLQAIDLSAYYAFGRRHPYKFFCGTQITMFGKTFYALCADRGPKDFDPDARTALSVDSFCKQRIFCVGGGRWVPRAAAIKFVAHLLDGAHVAGQPKTEEEAILEYIRRSVRYSRSEDGNLLISFNTNALTRQRAAETYIPTAFDPILAEMLCTAELISQSVDVRHLEALIRDELQLIPAIGPAKS